MYSRPLRKGYYVYKLLAFASASPVWLVGNKLEYCMKLPETNGINEIPNMKMYICAPFTETSYSVKYFKPIPKGIYQDT